MEAFQGLHFKPPTRLRDCSESGKHEMKSKFTHYTWQHLWHGEFIDFYNGWEMTFGTSFDGQSVSLGRNLFHLTRKRRLNCLELPHIQLKSDTWLGAFGSHVQHKGELFASGKPFWLKTEPTRNYDALDERKYLHSQMKIDLQTSSPVNNLSQFIHAHKMLIVCCSHDRKCLRFGSWTRAKLSFIREGVRDGWRRNKLRREFLWNVARIVSQESDVEWKIPTLDHPSKPRIVL